MRVSELISQLVNFSAQSPENEQAEVMLQYFDEQCYGIAGANDAKGFPGQHLLILIPDLKVKVGVKALKMQ